jgi:DNA-binding transcriptional MerR regulator
MKEKSSAFSCPAWSDLPDLELYMDQVVSVLERYLAPFFPEEEKRITSTMINNYVKQRLLPPPENKRYGKKHLAYLFIISILKRFMQLSDIHLLLERLVTECGMEKAYGLFTACLCRALSELFDPREKALSRETQTARVVRTCCEAFAAILYARSVFVSAGLTPPEVPAEEKKEKKEKKEPKEKEPKEKKKK